MLPLTYAPNRPASRARCGHCRRSPHSPARTAQRLLGDAQKVEVRRNACRRGQGDRVDAGVELERRRLRPPDIFRHWAVGHEGQRLDGIAVERERHRTRRLVGGERVEDVDAVDRQPRRPRPSRSVFRYPGRGSRRSRLTDCDPRSRWQDCQSKQHSPLHTAHRSRHRCTVSPSFGVPGSASFGTSISSWSMFGPPWR